MHLLFHQEQGREAHLLQLRLRALSKSVDLLDVVLVQSGGEDLHDGPLLRALVQVGNGPTERNPDVYQVNGAPENAAVFLYVDNRLLLVGVPVYDPQQPLLLEILGVDAHRVHSPLELVRRDRGQGDDDRFALPDSLLQEAQRQVVLFVP